jgi:hypothetical protein
VEWTKLVATVYMKALSNHSTSDTNFQYRLVFLDRAVGCVNGMRRMHVSHNIFNAPDPTTAQAIPAKSVAKERRRATGLFA